MALSARSLVLGLSVGCVPAVVGAFVAEETATVKIGRPLPLLFIALFSVLTVLNPVRILANHRPFAAWVLAVSVSGLWLWMVIYLGTSERSTASLAFWLVGPVLLVSVLAPMVIEGSDATRVTDEQEQ